MKKRKARKRHPRGRPPSPKRTVTAVDGDLGLLDLTV